jgi:hypothetical protein
MHYFPFLFSVVQPSVKNRELHAANGRQKVLSK